MGRSTNIITGLIVVLTVAVLVGGLFFILSQRGPEEVLQVPTLVVLPTETEIPPTNTPRPTLPATFTPTPTITLTPTITVSPTFTPSVSPTITDTPAPTATPATTNTPLPTATFTPTETSNVPTATPTQTRSPFPFAVRGGGEVFTQNRFNSQGCAFQAIGGQVLTLDGSGLNGVQVVVSEPGGSERSANSGTASAYGPGGYEIPVDDQINGRTYIVQLRADGAEISQPETVTFPSNCDQNIALIYWSQQRPF